MVTADTLRTMDVREVLRLVEQKIGTPVPSNEGLRIAALLGTGATGVRVIDPDPMGLGSYTEVLNFDAFAAWLNETPA